MIGKVIAVGQDGYFTVECADAPNHLKVLYLTDHKCDTRVSVIPCVLEYQTTTRNSGLWNVVEVVRRAED